MPGTAHTPLHYMVGSGIASLSAAAFLIRDAGVEGRHIRIFDDRPRPGGALDGWGDPTWGYLTRGGRMFEPNFVNTFDLLDTIPSADKSGISAGEDIRRFNREVRAASTCRLIAQDTKAGMDHLGLSPAQILALNRLMLTPEGRLAGRSIASWFDRAFFDTNFWIMWSTMFSFQPWHSLAEMRRYMRRFIHLLPGLTRIKGVLRTRYNQYDSLIAPLVDWLAARGVRIETGATVTGAEIVGSAEDRRIAALDLGSGERVPVAPEDRVLLTLGSMTDGATYGSNTAPAPRAPGPCPSWDLWRALARQSPGLGAPETFCGTPERTGWTSFTVTMPRAEFRDHIETLTGNATGTGGLVTIRDSAWLMSFVMFNQPHFRGQAEGSTVFWAYGLRGDRPGDFVARPMREATGDQMIEELCGHLRLSDKRAEWFAGARVLPCHMPFITSQFLPRSPGDRPLPRPAGARNFALMGQYVELPHDTVFTVEYSVRSAREAVHALTGHSAPIPVVRTDRDPAVLLRAARVLWRD